jgi:4-hydroxy-2-oxoheptanedioate aldolase
MNGAKLRARLQAGDSITMFNPHHVSPGLSVRLVELGADSIFVDCEHGTWSFEDVRITGQIVRGAGGAAIVRPHSHERPVLIRYLNAGADGIMVPMVDTLDQARAVVDAVRYALPSDHEKRLVVSMVETLEAIENLDEILTVDGIDVFFIGPGDLSQNMGYPPAPAFGEPRPEEVMERVAYAVHKIRDAGKIAGTLVTADEMPHWLEKGVQYFYVHSDPFLRIGMNGIKSILKR